MNTGPLRNITAEIDHINNNSLLRNSGSAKPNLSLTPATGPVYAPVYGPIATTTTNAMSVAAAPHAMLLQRSNNASTGGPALARGANGAVASASTTRLNPAAAEFGGLIGPTATKPARRVTLLRSSAPAATPTAPTATANPTKAQQDMMMQYQQMQQQQQQLAMMMLQQQMLSANSTAHPDGCSCAPCFTSQQQRMLAQQQQLFFGNDMQADTTRPQTPEANENNKENYAAVQSTPIPATSAFVSPAKPRATLYRPVARNFFVTPVKESTAAKGDQYLQNHTSSPSHHHDPMHANATPHSTPAGKGKRSNAIGKALQRDCYGIGERNTPKAAEKDSSLATNNQGANPAKANTKTTGAKPASLTNASRKLLIGDEEEHHTMAPPQRQNTSEPIVKNITSFFAASPQGRKAAAAATVSTAAPANQALPAHTSTPLRAPAVLAVSAQTPNNATRTSAHSSSAKSNNGSNYFYVEVEGLLGQRTYALTKVADMAPIGAHVLFEGDRGEDMGKVISISSQPPTAAQMSAAKANGASPSQHHNGNSPNGTMMMSPEASAMPVIPNAVLIRQASPEEISYWRNDLVAEAEDAVNKCTECIYRHNLNLIIVNAVFQFDRKKLTFYYETEQPRVDFRKMLAELYNEFHCRIWMERVE